MAEKVKTDEDSEKGSNNCVMDLSIDGGGEDKDQDEKDEGIPQILNRSFDDIKNFSQKLNKKDNFENMLDLLTFEEETKLRSKTISIKPKNLSAIK